MIIVDAITDSRLIQQLIITTRPPNAPRPAMTLVSDIKKNVFLPPSSNRLGGAQYSYSFWMKLSDVSSGNVQGKTIFLRGDDQRYPVKKIDLISDQSMLPHTNRHIVTSPLVAFGDTHRDIVVICNTTSNLLQSFDVHVPDAIVADIPNQWIMYTVTFEDNVPIDDFENGLLVKFFVNGQLIMRKTVHGALRLSEGDLFLLPNSTLLNGASFASLVYYPWAMCDKEVLHVFKKGPSKKKNC